MTPREPLGGLRYANLEALRVYNRRVCELIAQGNGMRVIKIALIVIGGLIGLLVVAAIAVLLWVDPNDYRGEIEQRVQQATGRPLRIAGKLDLKLFPWIALEVADVSLGNAPAYGPEPFLTVRRANVGVKLLPLLRKEVEVRRIALDGLSIALVTRGDEDNNWQDFGKNEKPDAAAAPTSTPPTSVAGIDIRDASLSYRDEVQKSATRFTHLNVTTGALGGPRPVPVTLDVDYDDGTPDSTVHLEAQATARLEGKSGVELRELALKGRAGKDGTAFTVNAPVLLVDWKAETLARTTFTIRYGELPLNVTAVGRKIFSNRVVSGTLQIDKVSPRALMKSMGMESPKARDPSALTALTVSSSYQLTETALALSGLALDLDDSKIRGKLGIDDLETKALSFDLDIDAINVDRYREPEPKPAANAKAEPPVDLPREMLRELKAKGLLRIGRLTVAELQLTEVRLPVDATGGIVKLAPQAKLFGGTYEGDIQLDARAAQLRMSTTDHIRGVDVGSIANVALKSKRLVGRGDANVVLSGVGNTDAQMMKSLAGKYDLNIRNGAVNGVDLWYELRRAVALIKRTEMPVRTEPVRTQFKTLTGKGTLSGGVIHDEDLRIDMDYIKARGKGTLAIDSEAVNYRLVAEVYKLPASGAGSEMADVKALEIPIAVTGTLADMKIRPDVGDLLKAKVRKEVGKHKEELKKKLDDKLKSLLNR